MDGVSLSYTCMASAISGGLRVDAGTWLGRLLTELNRLLKLITVLGSSAYLRQRPEEKGERGLAPGPLDF